MYNGLSDHHLNNILQDREIRAAADGMPEADAWTSIVNTQPSQSGTFVGSTVVNGVASGIDPDVDGHSAVTCPEDGDDESPQASVSFQLPVTPHLNRYSHSGQVPSCDARRPSSLKHVTAEDINTTASPILPDSLHKLPPQTVDKHGDAEPLTPIKTLDFGDVSDDDDGHPRAVFLVHGGNQLKHTMKSVTSTPDPNSLEKRHKIQARAAVQELSESPILGEERWEGVAWLPPDSQGSPSFRSDIDDMEKVRGHLHNMLKMSDDAMRGGKSAMASSRNELMMEETGRASSMDLFMGVKPPSSLFPEPQVGRYQADLTLVAENNALKEALENERYRRSHCEEHIQHLNTKMLDLQQQLAVSVATDHRKDSMIHHLDRQLAKVVEGWKRREADKETHISQLRNEKNKAIEELHHQQQLLHKFEMELRGTAEELKKERDSANDSVQQLRAQMSAMGVELSDARGFMENERERAEILQAEWEKAREACERAEKEMNSVNEERQREKEEWTDREREIKESFEEMSRRSEVSVQEERLKTDEETQRAEELKAELTRSETECKTLEMEVQCKNTEMEGLRVQTALTEAKHENKIRSLEADLRSELEQETANKVCELHKKMEAIEAAARESHRAQLREITAQHGAEVEGLTEQLHLREDTLMRLRADYENRLMESRNEMQNLKSQREKLQSQRSEALFKMQALMQSQWNEALSLLGSPNKANRMESHHPDTSPNQTFISNDTSHSSLLSTNQFRPPVTLSQSLTNENTRIHTQSLRPQFATNASEFNVCPNRGSSNELVSHVNAVTSVRDVADYELTDNFSPLSIMKRVDQDTSVNKTTDPPSLSVTNIVSHTSARAPRSSPGSQGDTTPSVSAETLGDNPLIHPWAHTSSLTDAPQPARVNRSYNDAELHREVDPEVRPGHETKCVHFSERDLLHSAEVLPTPSHAYSHPAPHRTRTPPYIVATAMRPPQQHGDWLPSDREISVDVTVAADQDDDDALFSPMPVFSDDESTVAERDEEVDAYQRKLQFSPPVKQTPPSRGDHSLMDETVRLNESYSDLSHKLESHESRQEELSRYVQMLLHRSPVSVAGDHSPTTDTDQRTDQNSFGDISGRRSSTPRQTAHRPDVLTDDKLVELSRLLGLYGGHKEKTAAMEHAYPGAMEVLSMIKNIQDSHTAHTTQSSPKTKPSAPRHALAEQNRKVNKKVTQRPTSFVTTQRDSATGRGDVEDRKSRSKVTTTARRPAPPSSARGGAQTKGGTVWK